MAPRPSTWCPGVAVWPGSAPASAWTSWTLCGCIKLPAVATRYCILQTGAKTADLRKTARRIKGTAASWRETQRPRNLDPYMSSCIMGLHRTECTSDEAFEGGVLTEVYRWTIYQASPKPSNALSNTLVCMPQIVLSWTPLNTEVILGLTTVSPNMNCQTFTVFSYCKSLSLLLLPTSTNINN